MRAQSAARAKPLPKRDLLAFSGDQCTASGAVEPLAEREAWSITAQTDTVQSRLAWLPEAYEHELANHYRKVLIVSVKVKVYELLQQVPPALRAAEPLSEYQPDLQREILTLTRMGELLREWKEKIGPAVNALLDPSLATEAKAAGLLPVESDTVTAAKCLILGTPERSGDYEILTQFATGPEWLAQDGNMVEHVYLGLTRVTAVASFEDVIRESWRDRQRHYQRLGSANKCGPGTKFEQRNVKTLEQVEFGTREPQALPRSAGVTSFDELMGFFTLEQLCEAASLDDAAATLLGWMYAHGSYERDWKAIGDVLNMGVKAVESARKRIERAAPLMRRLLESPINRDGWRAENVCITCGRSAQAATADIAGRRHPAFVSATAGPESRCMCKGEYARGQWLGGALEETFVKIS